jgi:hypothetical protein
MQVSSSALELSASDLSQFLSCRHLTALNLAVALGHRAAPTWIDPALVVLQQRGLDHERAYIDSLRAASDAFFFFNFALKFRPSHCACDTREYPVRRIQPAPKQPGHEQRSWCY